MTAAERAPGRSGLLEQLMALVRAEFRTDIYIPAPDDPVFIAEECAVAGCDRTAVSIRRGLCNAHAIRFRKRGRPPMEDFLAAPGPPVRGRRPLAPCVVEGCRYGRAARNGLCSKHRDRWDRAGKPDLATWKAPDLAPGDPARAECHLPFCDLWVLNPTKIFCTGHDDRWQRHGRPDPARFIAECELVGTACIDLQDLPPQLKLEIQYACSAGQMPVPAPLLHAWSCPRSGTPGQPVSPRCWTYRNSNGAKAPAPRPARRFCS